MSALLSLSFAAFLVFNAVRSRVLLRHSTAISSATWMTAATSLLMVLSAMRCLSLLPLRLDSAFQYAVSILLLLPFVDLLGARRPTHKAWPWFVLAPMIVVLQWPSISQCLSASTFASAVEIPAPTFVGFLFVVVMSCGNHIGTQQTVSTVLAAIGIVCIALPTSEWVHYKESALPLGSGLLVLATLAVRHPHPSSGQEKLGDQKLWADFRDIYGMVWAKRVMDRVNQFAVRESWPVRMTLDGFRNESGQVIDEVSEPNSRLCWVLRRFLSDDFLKHYVDSKHFEKHSKVE